MKRRLIAGALAAAMAFGTSAALPQGFDLFGSVMTAQAAYVSGDYEYIPDTNGNIISLYSGSATTLSFPSSIGGGTTYMIGKGGTSVLHRSIKKNVTSVTIPASVTTLGSSVFSGATGLTSVSFASGSKIQTIPAKAFDSCSALKSFTIPSTVTTIGDEAFNNCTGLTSLTIPANVTTIGKSAFSNCTSLKEVTIPKTVTSIGDEAFGYYNGSKISNFMFKCYSNTAASTYAEKYLNPENYTLLDSTHKHTFDDGIVTTQPTCTTKGVTTYTCTGCGQTKTEQNVKALGHNYTIFVETIPPTTTEMGYDIYKCSRCSATTKKNYKDVVKLGSLTNAKITGIESSYNYTGGKICPVPTVTLNNVKLTAGTDYTVEYFNNQEVGNNAMVVVTGKGNYTDQTSATFSIIKGVVQQTNINLATISGVSSSYSYTGAAIAPEPTVVYSGKVLKKGTDYTVSYLNNVSIGTATVTVSGKGSFTGSKSVTFSIVGATNISGATVSGVSNKTYTGSAITQSITVSYGGKTLTAGTDYTVSYGNNVNAGTATITITGKGSYTGTKTVNFTINAASLVGATVTGLSNKTYTGSAINQTVTVKLGSKTLTLNTDYTVSITNNTNAGTATVKITGKGNYTGTKSGTFTISAANISSATVSGIAGSYTYTGKAIAPVPTLTFNGKKLTANTDYTVAYQNNTNVGTATVTITGKGNFTGTKTVNFTISKTAVTRIPGDVNGDTEVDLKDVTALKQYMAKWNVTINEANSDVNGDGLIDVKDITLIKQRLANWNVKLI